MINGTSRFPHQSVFYNTEKRARSPKRYKFKSSPSRTSIHNTIQCATQHNTNITHLILQSLLPLNNSPHARNLFTNIPNTHLLLPDLQSHLLPILKTNSHLGQFGRVARQLLDFHVDKAGTGHGSRGGGAEEGDEDAAGTREAGEGVVGCFEGGYCADWEAHFGGCGSGFRSGLGLRRGGLVDGWFLGMG